MPIKKKKENHRKEIHYVASKKNINSQNKYKKDGKVLIPIDTVHNPLILFEKVIDFDKIRQHFKIELERYVSENGRGFAISIDEFQAFILINFAMECHNLSSLWLYKETVNPSSSVSYVAITFKREIIGNSEQSTFL